MPALRSSCLTQQPFRIVQTEFENCFLCLLRLSLCAVKRVDFQPVLCYSESRKQQFVRLPAGFTIWRKSMRVSLLTTPLTTYGFGLPGFYAAESTRKQSIRTQKPRKARQIKQKIRFLAFGSKFKQVRLLSSRPKISRKWGFSPHFRLIFSFAELIMDRIKKVWYNFLRLFNQIIFLSLLRQKLLKTDREVSKWMRLRIKRK